MKKTLITLLMVLLCAMLIISCSNEPKDNGSSTTPSETPTETPTTPTTSTYTVTFDVNGGTGTVANKTTGTDGKVSKPETAPKKTNAVFLYWSKDKSSEFKFDTAITENTTLYAVWKTEFSVGDVGPAGGIIFYDVDADNNIETVDKDGARKYNLDGLTSSECGWRYLEVSPSDLTYTDDEGKESNTFIFGFNWSMATGNATMLTCGATESKIGKGQANTSALVQTMKSEAGTSIDNYMSNTPIYAAKLCDDYECNDYVDWFLPSLYELNALYTEYKNGKIGGTWHSEKLSSGYVAYWSSTESNKVNAYTVDFSDGTERTTGRQDVNNRYVRAVRAF